MSKIINPHTYFSLIKRILKNGSIIFPKKIKDIFVLRKGKNGELIGWEIKNVKVLFYNNDFLKVNEKAKSVKSESIYIIDEHTYHFNPQKKNGLECFRIDKKKSTPLHANDERAGENKHLSADELTLDISEFNLYLAVHLALLYIAKRLYPLDNRYGDMYNKELNKYRRECNE